MELKPVKGLRPFTKFLMTIGELPSSYLVSMTYEEQLLWFCNYLQNVVIPTVDNNAEAVIELQEFVSNYFDNLDVQEEINNKLDEMAESGELTEIIAAYLSLAALFCYDTIADMAASENLDAGSSCYCLGKDTYNDGKGAFYKIREITISDVIDGYNIVAITNTDDLIGERLPNYEINQINTTLNTLTTETIPGIQNDIDTINNTTIPAIQDDVDTLTNTTIPAIEEEISTIADKKWIFIGDSYGQGYTPDGNVNGWPGLLKTKMGLDNNHCIIAVEGGGGFASAEHPYSGIINNLTADNDVTDILIAGGYNDTYYASNQIENGMTTCRTLINTKFPNAKVHIGFIGGSTNQYHSSILKTIMIYVNKGNDLNFNYLPNLQYILFDSRLFSSDGIHPNQDGEDAITNGLYAALNGEYNYYLDTTLTIDTSASDHFTSASSMNVRLRSNNNTSTISKDSGVNLSADSAFSISNGDFICLGKIQQYGIIGAYNYNSLYNLGEIIIYSSSNPSGFYNCDCQLFINWQGMVYLKLIPKINKDNNNYQTWSNCTSIQIPSFGITFLTDAY